MSFCQVCKKYSKKHSTLNFFRFPRDPLRCELWAKNCNLIGNFNERGSKYFYQNYRICSDHFQKDAIYWDGKKNRLHLNAIPVVIEPPVRSVRATVVKPMNLEAANHIDKILACDDSEFQLGMMEHTCRLCGEEHNVLTSIFGSRGKDLDLENKMKFIPTKVLENDGLPNKVCSYCIKKLETTFTFFSKCFEAEKKLNLIFNMDTTSCKNVPISKPSAVDIPVSAEPRTPRSVDFASSWSLQHDYDSIIVKTSDKAEERLAENRKGEKFCKSLNKFIPEQEIHQKHSVANVFTIDSTCCSCECFGSSTRSRHRLCVRDKRHTKGKANKYSLCSSVSYNQQLCRINVAKTSFSNVCKHSLLFFRRLQTKYMNLHVNSFRCLMCTRSFSALAGLRRHWKCHWPRNVHASIAENASFAYIPSTNAGHWRVLYQSVT